MLNFSICLVMINKNKNREGEKWVGTKVYWIISKVHGGGKEGDPEAAKSVFGWIRMKERRGDGVLVGCSWSQKRDGEGWEEENQRAG